MLYIERFSIRIVDFVSKTLTHFLLLSNAEAMNKL